MQDQDVVIVSGARTAIGTFGGAFREVTARDLAAAAIREAVSRSGLRPDEIEEVVLGCVGQIGENAYVARTAALTAGLPQETTAFTVNRLCGSGLQAVVSAAQVIQTGGAERVVAGGTEQMSGFPFLDRQTRWGQRLGSFQMEDALTSALTCPFNACHMGVTGENVAEQYGVSRADQDAFALESQRRAAAAIAAGRFTEQIVPVAVPQRRGDPKLVQTDEHPKPDSTAEGLAALRPVFKKDGSVTAGNASGINDAAAALVLTSGRFARQRGLKPLLRLRASAVAGVDPAIMGIGPIPAVRKVLARAGLSAGDLDLVELNEAFAAQALAVIRDLDLDPARVNPNGGAIALGHPVGATGSILTVKSLYELQRADAETALVTMCIGGGQGIAAIFERLN
jgi:acetyl-CoA C-acetyltransferase